MIGHGQPARPGYRLRTVVAAPQTDSKHTDRVGAICCCSECKHPPYTYAVQLHTTPPRGAFNSIAWLGPCGVVDPGQGSKLGPVVVRV